MKLKNKIKGINIPKILISIILIYSFDILYCQSDPVIKTKDADFSFYITQKVKYNGSNEIHVEKHISNFNEVQCLTFLNNDSISLLNMDREKINLRVKDLYEVSIYKKKFSPIAGTLIGAVVGCITGALIGYAAETDEVKHAYNLGEGLANILQPSFNKGGSSIVGGIIGTLGGAALGFIIVNAINNESFGIFSVPNKDKKNKLIRFLKSK